MSIEVRIIWYQSIGSKIRFTIPLSFLSCYHLFLFLLCSLFLALVLWHAPSLKKKVKKRSSQKRKETEKYCLKFQFSQTKILYSFVLFLWFIVFVIFSCHRYCFKYYKLNFLIKFISLMKNWKGETTSGKRQESMRLISWKRQFKSETRVWVT